MGRRASAALLLHFMTKLILILVAGLVLEAVGVVLLSQGLHEIGEVKRISAGEIALAALPHGLGRFAQILDRFLHHLAPVAAHFLTSMG